jgi:hypothetical protein
MQVVEAEQALHRLEPVELEAAEMRRLLVELVKTEPMVLEAAQVVLHGVE